MKTQWKDTVPESEEERFRQKCKELKKRVLEVEQTNEVATIALSRTQASIRRLRLEYAILIERLEDRAQHLPDGVTNFEEMAGPPTPSILDENLVKSSKNGSGKKPGKKATTTGGKITGNGSSASPAEADARSLMNLATSTGNVTTASAITPKTPSLAKNPKYRDPDLPKRPTNAYLLFCEQEKERLRQQQQEDPENNTRDLSKAMTEAWKGLSEEDRKPFYKLYEEDRVRYQREMAEYNQKKEAELERAAEDEDGDGNGDGNGDGDGDEDGDGDGNEEGDRDGDGDGDGDGNGNDDGDGEKRDEDEREAKRQKPNPDTEISEVQTEQPQDAQVKIEQDKAE
ncbi:NHP10 [Candida margitis]|uniref:NHP10 n=1 Tax=Candida margitis TaxID=1775924 RepID=UPI002227ED6A|nr:NHP10 [Candida margitis]KAI5966087.1 NHP10 [Candida margitis]